MHGVKTRAAELGVTLAIPSIGADNDIAAAVADMVGQRVDAVILPGNLVVQPYSFTAFNAAAIPVIIAEFSAGPEYTCSVHTNELQGADWSSTIWRGRWADLASWRISSAGKPRATPRCMSMSRAPAADRAGVRGAGQVDARRRGADDARSAGGAHRSARRFCP